MPFLNGNWNLILPSFISIIAPIDLREGLPRIIGAIIDLKEGNIRLQLPLKKGMEHFLKNKFKLPYESIMRATYEPSAKMALLRSIFAFMPS